MEDYLLNIRLLTQVEQLGVSLRPGQCMKAYIFENGMARVYKYPKIQLYPEEYEVVLSESVFDKLLKQGY